MYEEFQKIKSSCGWGDSIGNEETTTRKLLWLGDSIGNEETITVWIFFNHLEINSSFISQIHYSDELQYMLHVTC